MAPVAEQVRARSGLHGLVAGYTGYREQGVAPAQHRGLPSPYLTFLLTLHEPLVLAAHPDPAQPPSSHDTLVGGLHTRPALITHEGSQAGVQVFVHPLGARALFGLPAGELAGLDLEGDDLLGRVAAQLRERLAAAQSWPERFALLEQALRPQDDARVAPEVRYAWRRIVTSGGRVRVADLAAETGWSPRHLAARFGVEVGLSPKAACRVVRFDRTRRRLQASGRAVRLAEVAADGGYADQAHLAREFRALAGCPPSQWLAEVRNVQAAPLPGAAP